MDEFNREAWEMDRALNRYHRIDPARRAEDPNRWTVGNILGGLLLVSIGGFLIWGTYDDLAEHFKPAHPVEVKQEAAPDITGQIRSLERMIAEAKQLNVEITAVHDSIKKDLAAQAR